ncbi:hypothetical protein WR25_02032 [Diploscapter pachys]|uniref:Uncharacterized protein n=1 Tax=Diploscapter pachys TaxID=2018661 RepID=A0A2A2K9T1_9BILA|nr:hypothetical protein WR25_02032 [Diploscapter pachys]
MIGIGALAALISLIAIFVLDRLVYVTSPIYPLQSRDQQLAMQSARRNLASCGIIKFLFALGTLGLAVFIEYEHEKVSGQDKYIKIALEHIAACLAVVSGALDIVSSKVKRQQELNLKAGLALSVVAAVWCIKTVDHNMYPFYKNDLKYYYQGRMMQGILFFLCCLSSLIIATYLQLDFLSMNLRISKSLTIQNRMLSFLHVLWGACLMALCILGLLNVLWRGEFVGGDLCWLSILFITTGILGSNNYGAMINIRFIMNIVCLGIAVEKMCASINLIYQFASYDAYVRGPNKQYIGQIVLISIQTGVFAAESLTALTCAILFGRELSRVPSTTYRSASAPQLLFSLGVLFYAIVITGCYVVFEVGKWRYNEIPIEVPFFRIGNGPLAGAVFIVQVFTLAYPSLLAASTILHVVIAALALFTISPAITNVYYIQKFLQAADIIRATSTQETIYQVALILAAGATLACVIATLCSTLCCLRSSYLLHHRATSPGSTVVAPLGDENVGSLGSGSLRVGIPGPMIQHPARMQPSGAQRTQSPLRPIEEQSMYWSADENPHYYHTSRRYYGQPYQIESGFYGYALANSSSAALGHTHASHSSDELREREQRRGATSSASQTQIGHIFS